MRNRCIAAAALLLLGCDGQTSDQAKQMLADVGMMQPARTWRGLWNVGWEWTEFCPAPEQECPNGSEADDIWLEFADRSVLPREPADGVYQVEFIGRRTMLSGGYGHLGQYEHLIVVDRVISIQKIPGETYQNR